MPTGATGDLNAADYSTSRCRTVGNSFGNALLAGPGAKLALYLQLSTWRPRDALRLFHTIEPYLCSGLLDDPLLLVRVRPTGRSLLFDCGQLQHSPSAPCVHRRGVRQPRPHGPLMGLDHLVATPRVTAPARPVWPAGDCCPGGTQTGRLRLEPGRSVWRTIHVHEVHEDRIEHHQFAGAKGFTGERLGSESRCGTTIHIEAYVTVEAKLCDHGLPVLAFR